MKCVIDDNFGRDMWQACVDIAVNNWVLSNLRGFLFQIVLM
jgi:hypothetical protein